MQAYYIRNWPNFKWQKYNKRYSNAWHLNWLWFGCMLLLFFFKYSYLLIHVRLDVQFLWDRQTKYLVCQPSFYNLNFCFTQKKSGWDSILAQNTVFRLFLIEVMTAMMWMMIAEVVTVVSISNSCGVILLIN